MANPNLLSAALNLLPVVGPAVAALPEFKRLYEQLGLVTGGKADQDTLKRALDLAVQDRDAAHNDLQALVRERQ